MVTVIPYIPEFITVHLGAPDSNARNVTVPYLDYLKNVVAGEIYPTWEPSAIRANVLAINSYALNRVYTEYYRSRGYDFDITSSTAYDQSFHPGRSTFDTTDRIVEQLFDTYIRRMGFVEPLAAKFCNGTTSTCAGLSQWGSQNLAEQGYDSVQILRSYYGDDIELVSGGPVRGIEPSYPGQVLRQGDRSDAVTVVQVSLNRISQNYPAIPKITPVDGIFGPATRAAVVAFQRIFGLAPDGLVGKITWYQIVRLYVAVTKLAELQSEGQQFYAISWAYPEAIRPGDTGAKVTHLQYLLEVVGEFVPGIPVPETTGTYDDATREAVLAFQRYAGLPETGEVDRETWDALYNDFLPIENELFRNAALFPVEQAVPAANFSQLQTQLQTVSAAYPSVSAPAASGRYDRATRQALSEWQRVYGLPRTGRPDAATKRSLANGARELEFSRRSREDQFPGTELAFGRQDDVPSPEQRRHPLLFSVGAPVRSMQTMLRRLGYAVIPDGVYEEQTMAAVMAFQKDHGLPVTGITDQATWDAIAGAE